MLLGDQDCPRSVLFCLREAGALLDGAGAPTRLAAALAEEVAAAGQASLLPGRGAELRQLLAGCQELDAAITAHWLELPEAS